MKVICLFLLLLSPSLSLAGTDRSVSYFCSNPKTGTAAGIRVDAGGEITKLIKIKGQSTTVIGAPLGRDPLFANEILSITETNGFVDSTYDRGRCEITYHSGNNSHTVKYGGKGPKPIKEIFVKLQEKYRSSVEAQRAEGLKADSISNPAATK